MRTVILDLPARGSRVFSHPDECLYGFLNTWFFLCTYQPSLPLLFRFELSSSLLDFLNNTVGSVSPAISPSPLDRLPPLQSPLRFRCSSYTLRILSFCVYMVMTWSLFRPQIYNIHLAKYALALHSERVCSLTAFPRSSEPLLAHPR